MSYYPPGMTPPPRPTTPSGDLPPQMMKIAEAIAAEFRRRFAELASEQEAKRQALREIVRKYGHKFAKGASA